MPVSITFSEFNIGSPGIGIGAVPVAALEERFSIGAPVQIGMLVTLAGSHADATPASWEGSRFYVRPAFWEAGGAVLNTIGPVRWAVEVPQGGIGSQHYMSLQGAGLNTDSRENVEFALRVDNDLEAYLIIDTIMTIDLASWLSATGVLNRDRLMRSRIGDPLELSNGLTSVYSSLRLFSTFCRWEQNGSTVEFQTGLRWKNAFYGMAHGGGTSPNPGFTLEITSGGTGTQLSPIVDNGIRLRLPSPSWVPDECYVYLLDLNAYTNTGKWWEDLVIDRVLLVDQPSNTPLPGATVIKGAALKPYLSGSDYLADFVIDPSVIELGGGYAVVAVWSVWDGSTFRTLSDIAAYLTGDAPLSPLSLPITGNWIDAKRIAGGNVKTCPVDRLRSKLQLDVATYDAAAATTPGATDFETDFQELRLTVDDGTDVFFDQTITRLPGQSWPSTKWMKVTEGATWTLHADLRMLFANDAGLPDWASNSSLRARWMITCLYPDLSSGTRYIYNMPFEVTAFGTGNPAEDVISEINLYDYQTGLPLQNPCNVEKALVEVIIGPLGTGTNWNLIAFVDKAPFGVDLTDRSLSEFSSFSIPTELPQLQVAPILSADAAFSSDRAIFVLDLSDYTEGSSWKVYAIAKDPS